MQNPLIPTQWELLVTAIGLLIIALAITAVVSLARDRHYTPQQRLLWLVVVLLAPIVGSVLWLSIGRRADPQNAVRR